MTKVTITTSSEGGGFIVRFCGGKPYVFRALVGSLKDIPRERRSYDPVNKQWSVCDRARLENWIDFALRLGAEVRWDGYVRQPPQPPSPPKWSPREAALATLHLLPSAPPQLIRGAHKILALINHPDRGGDVETMKRINNAFDALTKGGAK